MNRSIKLFYFLHVAAIMIALLLTKTAQAQDNNLEKVIATQQVVISDLQTMLAAQAKQIEELQAAVQGLKSDAGTTNSKIQAVAKKAENNNQAIGKNSSAIGKNGNKISSNANKVASVDKRLGNFSCNGSKCSIPNGHLHISYKRDGKKFSLWLPEGWTNRASICREGSNAHCSAFASPP